MCEDSERLSLDEFLLVSLGSLLGSWDGKSTQTPRLARVVAEVASQLSSVSQPSQQTQWVRLLGQAANRLLYPSNEDRPVYQRLVSLGKRRASHLLDGIPPVFGLQHIPTLLENMDNTEDKLQLMRRVALRLAKARKVDPKDMYVVYRFRDINGDLLGRRGSKAPLSPHFVYTTVLAQQEGTLKRDSEGQPVTREKHVRWIYHSSDEQKRTGEEYFAALKESLPSLTGRELDDFYLEFQPFVEEKTVSSSRATPARNLSPVEQVPYVFELPFPTKYFGSPELSEPDFDLDLVDDELDFDPNLDYVNHEIQSQPHEFAFVTGVHGACGIYVDPKFNNKFPEYDSNLDVATLDDVEWALSKSAFSQELLVEFFGRPAALGLKKPASVRAFAAVVETYSDLANSTIALKATYAPLDGLNWARYYPLNAKESGDPDEDFKNRMLPIPLSRELRFALLVYLETGHADVDPRTLDRVVAVCSGDSIFVSAPVLLDPFEITNESSARLCCLRGNIGRAGIALLTTPDYPLMKSSQEASWRAIGHEQFDGELLDSFKGTSLQLGFTNFKLPIDTGNLGAYDMDLVFMEAIIRVNDRNGTWIGDLNILKAMEKWNRVELPTDCNHKGDDRDASNIPYATAIDNWDEFLDEPEGAMVFRARGNWIARLSAAGFGGQQRKRLVVIVPHGGDVCWNCFYNSVNRAEWSNFLLIC